MTRIILTYGAIAGAVAIAGIIASMQLDTSHGSSSLLVGYLIMLVALTAILVGVKQHRDRDLGGVIRFGRALAVGLGIALTAGVVYVLVWELYQALNHYSFMDGYIRETLAAKRAAGVSGAAYAKAVAEMEEMRRNYENPLFRAGMTFVEIFPVGLLVALVTAVLVRNPRFLPARARAS